MFVVAEVGSNYDGDLETAKRYIEAAKAAGAQAVKFQTLRRDKLVAPNIQVDGVWQRNPTYERFGNLELPDEWHFALKRTADSCGIEFLSTPFYIEAVDLLERVGVATYKVASGDITFRPLLEAVGRTKKRVLLSSGASTLADVERALNTLTRAGAREVVVLHCVSNYPPDWDEMNLRAIVTIKERFGVPVGISDHSPGSTVPIVARALGATVVEKHVTFDRALPGPDHPFALTMDECAEMVRQLHLVERALGTGDKVPTPREQEKQRRLRRGVYDPITLAPSDRPDGVWLRPEWQA